MKKVMLAMMVLGMGMSAMAADSQVIEKEILKASCSAPANEKVESLCAQLENANLLATKSNVIAKEVSLALKTELMKDSNVLNFGGLSAIETKCNSQVENVYFCSTQVRAGGDEGLLLIDIQSIVEQKANGDLVRKELSRKSMNVD